jgi:hypothetical protein
MSRALPSVTAKPGESVYILIDSSQGFTHLAGLRAAGAAAVEADVAALDVAPALTRVAELSPVLGACKAMCMSSAVPITAEVSVGAGVTSLASASAVLSPIGSAGEGGCVFVAAFAVACALAASSAAGDRVMAALSQGRRAAVVDADAAEAEGSTSIVCLRRLRGGNPASSFAPPLPRHNPITHDRHSRQLQEAFGNLGEGEGEENERILDTWNAYA